MRRICVAEPVLCTSGSGRSEAVTAQYRLPGRRELDPRRRRVGGNGPVLVTAKDKPCKIIISGMFVELLYILTRLRRGDT